jgi:hypothetical protein
VRSKIMMGALVACAALCFGALAAASAMAVSPFPTPAGPVTGTSGPVTFSLKLPSGEARTVCNSSTLPATVTKSGEGKRPIVGGNPTFSGCTTNEFNGGGGATTITATAPSTWTAIVSGGVKTTVESHLHFTENGSECEFDLAGTWTAVNPGTYPETVSTLQFSTTATHVSHSTGWGFCRIYFPEGTEGKALPVTYQLSHGLLFG